MPRKGKLQFRKGLSSKEGEGRKENSAKKKGDRFYGIPTTHPRKGFSTGFGFSCVPRRKRI